MILSNYTFNCISFLSLLHHKIYFPSFIVFITHPLFSFNNINELKGVDNFASEIWYTTWFNRYVGCNATNILPVLLSWVFIGLSFWKGIGWISTDFSLVLSTSLKVLVKIIQLLFVHVCCIFWVVFFSRCVFYVVLKALHYLQQIIFTVLFRLWTKLFQTDIRRSCCREWSYFNKTRKI